MSINGSQLPTSKGGLLEEHAYKPLLLRLKFDQDKETYEKVRNKPGIVSHDTLVQQLHDLIRTRNPGHKLTVADVSSLAAQHLEGVDHLDMAVGSIIRGQTD